jgi:type IV pilus assembly protein PilM
MMFTKSNTVVGLDISKKAIKVVELKKIKERISLINLGLESVEVTKGMSEKAKMDAVVHAIRHVFKENRIKTKKVITSIPGSSVVIRYINFPVMTRDELMGYVKYEAADYIPFGVENCVLDFQILREFVDSDHDRKMEVVIVAARRELIDDHIRTLKKAGLTPLIIDVDIFAIEEVWSFSSGVHEGIVALVDIGESVTNIHIVEDGVSRFNRDISFGGESFTESIAAELGVGFDEAEEIKKDSRFIFESQEVEDEGKDGRMVRISEAMKSSATSFLRELDRSFAYFFTQAKKKEKRVDRIILNGGSAALSGLDRFLSASLEVPVEICNPLSGLYIDPIRFDAELIEKMAPLFSVCVGLALRGLSGQ